ncbi:MAG TPA: hypothetical protein VFJ07_11345 [Streptosporangiaceae bacterium]|nr:hypothetical protein [Streptosporangiaceae bacterium]
MRWSVGIEADAGRVLTREEVVELADAVAASDGIASGIGSDRYGARMIVTAGSRDEAVEAATKEFSKAVATAGLPAGPIVTVEAISEAEDDGAGLPGDGA